MAVVQGTPWLIGLSLLTPGWVNIGQPTAASSGSVNSAGQYRLYVRVRHYTDFIRTTVEVRASLRSPVQRFDGTVDAAAGRSCYRIACAPLARITQLPSQSGRGTGTIAERAPCLVSGGGHTAKLGKLPGKLLPLRRSASAIPPSQRA